MGTAARVSPVVSNELLARRTAAHDLQMGLQAASDAKAFETLRVKGVFFFFPS